MRKVISFLLMLIVLAGCQGEPESQSKKEVEPTDTKLSFTPLNQMSHQDKIDIGSWILKEHRKRGEQITAILTNLNDDQFKDLIVIKGHEYCGTGGCSAVALVSPKYDGYDILNSFFVPLPVYVKQGSTNGLRDLFIDEKWLCKFNTEKLQYHCE
jgi:hypothetical protein